MKSSDRVYRDELANDWYLGEMAKTRVAAYFLRQTYYSFLNSVVKDGIILIGSRPYQIKWLDRPTHIKEHGFAVLSFRWCNDLRNGYVLIKCLHGKMDCPRLEDDNGR